MSADKKISTNYGYLRIFVWTAVAMVGVALGGVYSYLFIFLYCVLAVFDQVLEVDTRNYAEQYVRQVSENKFYRYLTYVQLPVQLLCMCFVLWRLSATDTELYERVGMLLSAGIVFGNIGINVAHELVHKKNALEQMIGGVLLATTCYGTFKIEHIRWHHVHVATPLDPSTSKLGQSLYHFLLQVYRKNFINGFRLEAQRLKSRSCSAFSHHNEALIWSALSLFFAVIIFNIFGLMGVVYFLIISLIAITALETINYVEHYGLERRKMENGEYEPVTHQHSWNSSHVLSNYGLLNLPRHSDHHAFPRRRYQVLRHFEDSPQLPAGYASMILLAFVPLLWRKVMDPLVAAQRHHAQPKSVT